MIVKNEAVALPECLRSAAPYVDEIVVLDTGSTDETVAIAQSFQAGIGGECRSAQVHHYSWNDDFAAARNASLQYAQGEWILVLDADEVLLADSVPQLYAAMQRPEALVINLLRHEVGAKQAPYSLISRLFRNRSDISFSRPYHELIDDSVLAILQQEPAWVVTDLPEVAIVHTGYQSQAIAQRQKGDRAQRMMERYLATHPTDAYICNKLGGLYLDAGEVVRAKKLLERGLRSHNVEAPVLYELHYHLGSLYSQQQNFAQATRHFQTAIAQPILPTIKVGAYLHWGNVALEQGNAIAAAELYTTVLRIAPDLAVAHYNLGLSLKGQGDLRGAIACYQAAIARDPDYADAYQNLGVALLKLGQVADSLAAFERAIALHRQAGSPEAERLRQGLVEMGWLAKS
jgi:tetratricopeptide (TPR) repeat protein